jgi:Transposase IS116/IS110/IS902 family
VHPGLERGLDVTKKAPLALLTQFVIPAEIRTAGARRIAAHLIRTPHLRETRALGEEVVRIAKTQTIAVPGETIAAALIRELAVEVLAAKTRIAAIDRDLAALLAVHPDGALIRSLPGMGVVLAAELIAHLGTITRFASADALAAAAGPAPVGSKPEPPTRQGRRQGPQAGPVPQRLLRRHDTRPDLARLLPAEHE